MVRDLRGELDKVGESEGETGEVVGTTSDEEGAGDGLVVESGIELQATSISTTTVSE